MTRQKQGSVGLPHFFTDVRIADEHGAMVPRGTIGEIEISGPNVFPGYHGLPEATADAFTADGWFRSGDLGYLDPDGYLYIADRLKDMIISGGENIYPAEIENLINDIDGVTGVAVIGVPDERWGEVPWAIVTDRAAGIVTTESVRGHLDGKDRALQDPQEGRRRRRAAAHRLGQGAQGRPAGTIRRIGGGYLLTLPMDIGILLARPRRREPATLRKGPPAVVSTAHAVNPTAARRLLDGFSLEMTGKDVPGLEEARHAIPAGTKINVTFLGNEDLEMRVAAAKAVRDFGFVPVPHISARRLKSQDQLEEFLGRLQEVGATEHVFSVGGDPAEPRGALSRLAFGDPHRTAAEVRGARGVDRGVSRGSPRHQDGRALAAPRGQIRGTERAGPGCRHPDAVRVRHRPGDVVDPGCPPARHPDPDPRSARRALRASSACWDSRAASGSVRTR